MSRIKKLGGVVAIVFILSMFLFGFRWLYFNVIKSAEVLDGMVAFRTAVAEDIESGTEMSVYYVKNVKKSDVHNINKYIDSALGSVDTYRIVVESGEYLAIQLGFQVSDNYYVLRRYLYGEAIPEGNEKASEIYDAVSGFITSNITAGMSDFDKEIAVHDYIVSNCVYGYPSDEDDAYTAYGALVAHQAVCDGYAEAFYLIMTCLGADCDIVVGSTEEGLHAWNQIDLDGEWYNIDLTWDDSLPDMGSHVKHTYVNLTDEELERSHTWEKQFYHECDADAYNYYEKKFYAYDSFEEYKSGIRLQLGSSHTLESSVYTDESSYDLSFLYSYGNISTINYVIEDMGDYKVIIVYINL